MGLYDWEVRSYESVLSAKKDDKDIKEKAEQKIKHKSDNVKNKSNKTTKWSTKTKKKDNVTSIRNVGGTTPAPTAGNWGGGIQEERYTVTVYPDDRTLDEVIST